MLGKVRDMQIVVDKPKRGPTTMRIGVSFGAGVFWLIQFCLLFHLTPACWAWRSPEQCRATTHTEPFRCSQSGNWMCLGSVPNNNRTISRPTGQPSEVAASTGCWASDRTQMSVVLSWKMSVADLKMLDGFNLELLNAYDSLGQGKHNYIRLDWTTQQWRQLPDDSMVSFYYDCFFVPIEYHTGLYSYRVTNVHGRIKNSNITQWKSENAYTPVGEFCDGMTSPTSPSRTTESVENHTQEVPVSHTPATTAPTPTEAKTGSSSPPLRTSSDSPVNNPPGDPMSSIKVTSEPSYTKTVAIGLGASIGVFLISLAVALIVCKKPSLEKWVFKIIGRRGKEDIPENGIKTEADDVSRVQRCDWSIQTDVTASSEDKRDKTIPGKLSNMLAHDTGDRSEPSGVIMSESSNESGITEGQQSSNQIPDNLPLARSSDIDLGKANITEHEQRNTAGMASQQSKDHDVVSQQTTNLDILLPKLNADVIWKKRPNAGCYRETCPGCLRSGSRCEQPEHFVPYTHQRQDCYGCDHRLYMASRTVPECNCHVHGVSNPIFLEQREVANRETYSPHLRLVAPAGIQQNTQNPEFGLMGLSNKAPGGNRSFRLPVDLHGSMSSGLDRSTVVNGVISDINERYWDLVLGDQEDSCSDDPGPSVSDQETC